MGEEVVQLPEDQIYSIFLRLPPESLIRFYTLSKQWNHVITSNTFFADYRARVSIIVRTIPGQYYSHVRLHRLCPPRTSHQYLLTSDQDSPTVIRIPFHEKQPRRQWISSCHTDGLLCVVYMHASKTDIAVWNPCTNRHRMVSWNGGIWDDRDRSIDFVGFGYDARVCDYKVVVVCSSYIGTRYDGCCVYVTALKSGVWQRANAHSNSLFEDNKLVPISRLGYQFQFDVSVAVGDDLYWLCKKTEDNSLALLSFNLIEEKLTVLSPPLSLVEINNRERLVRLGVSNGCLHLFCLSSEDNQCIDVWKHSNNDGSGENWNRVSSLPKLFAFGYGYKGSSIGFVSEGVLVAKSTNYGIYTFTPQRGLAFMKSDPDEQPSRFNPSIHLLETSFVIP